MSELTLRDAFEGRKNRFRLLDAGIALAGWSKGGLSILEIGCGDGGAAGHIRAETQLELCPVDIDRAAVKAAKKKYGGRFVRADACRLPFGDGSFDGVLSEAAFSVIPHKEAAAGEYLRVLRSGGRILVNDFILRGGPGEPASGRWGIPCLDGVGTEAEYVGLFARAGACCVYRREHYFELLAIAEGLCRCYGIPAGELGGFIAESFGGDGSAAGLLAGSGLSYAQLIFEKERG